MNYDVVIAGAGPVGLFLACELAMRDVRVLVIERLASPESVLKRRPFGIRGLSSLSVEALDRRGFLDELQLHKQMKNPHMSVSARRQLGHFAGISFFEDTVDVSVLPYRLPTSTPVSLLTDMEELEAIFTRRAVSMGVEIRRGVGVENLDFGSAWIVGCDGGRSAVRKLGGFEFAGTEPEFTGYSAMIDLVDPEKLKLGRNLTDTGMYLQSQPGYFAMVEFDGGQAHGREVTLESVQGALRRISGTDVSVRAIQTVTTWTDRARQATEYRRGRVVLAGDAAHIHSPLGGQGLNLGLGDAMNLGWRLAEVVRDPSCADAHFASYFAERHPVGAQVLDWSRAQVAIMRPTPSTRALNAVMRDLIETRDGATYFASRVWAVNTKYDLGGDHPLVGRSAPNFALATGTLNELLRDGHAHVADVDAFGVTRVSVRPDGIIDSVVVRDAG